MRAAISPRDRIPTTPTAIASLRSRRAQAWESHISSRDAGTTQRRDSITIVRAITTQKKDGFCKLIRLDMTQISISIHMLGMTQRINSIRPVWSYLLLGAMAKRLP